MAGGDQQPQFLCQQYLFPLPQNYPAGSVGGSFPAAAGNRQSRCTLPVPGDGSGCKLGEHAQPGRIGQQILFRRDTAGVYIHRIADGLKGKKADPQRQGQLQQGQRDPGQAIERPQQKICILENQQRPQAQCQRQSQQTPAACL